jgi:DNA-directed RNA polymerase specialized sigma24 family protein
MQGVGSLSIADQDRLVAEAMQRDAARLRSFVRKRVIDLEDAEDVLQDVFFELVRRTG